MAGAAIVRSHGTQVLDEVYARREADKTILGSVRSTLRAPVGRMFNRMMGGGIRHGTGNECEDRFLRFYQKGGDGEVDSNPLAMLSKTEVYQLAFALGQRFDGVALGKTLMDHDLTDDDDCAHASRAYKATIEATPSPDLWGEGDGHSDEAELLAMTGAPFTYGRIDPLTGSPTSYGTIERVSRFLDEYESRGMQGPLINESILFTADRVNESDLYKAVKRSAAFAGMDYALVDKLLYAARKVERQTRHKANPNIPTYGSREDLVDAGILTNRLEIPHGK